MDDRVLGRMDAPALREYIRCLLEKKGKSEGVPVTDEDLPFDLGSDDSEPDDDASESGEAEAPVPPKKKKKCY